MPHIIEINHRFKYIVLGEPALTTKLLGLAMEPENLFEETVYIARSKVASYRNEGYKIYAFLVDPMVDYLFFCNKNEETPGQDGNYSGPIFDHYVYQGKFLPTNFDRLYLSDVHKERGYLPLQNLNFMLDQSSLQSGEVAGNGPFNCVLDKRVFGKVKSLYAGLTLPQREDILDMLSPEYYVWNTLA